MKRFKAILALILVCALFATLFAACSSESGSSDGSSSSGSSNTGNSGNTNSGDDEDLVEIEMFLMQIAANSADSSYVSGALQDAVNAITEPQLGVHVNLRIALSAEYATQMPLELAGGTQLDIICISPNSAISLSTLYANNQLVDISPYLDTVGQDILAAVGDYLGAVTINGGVYMVPNVRNYASSVYAVWNKEWIDELGYGDTISSLSSWSEFEEVCTAIYDKYGVSPIAARGNSALSGPLTYGDVSLTGEGKFADAEPFDYVGDGLLCIMTDPDTNKVSNHYTDPNFVAACEKAAEWYNKGWIYPDAPYTTDETTDQIANEVAGVFFCTSELGVEIQKASSCAHELYSTKIVDTMVTSGVVFRFGLGVGITSEEPEAAVKVLNLLMTSSELNNILDWGIEGQDYTVEDGQAVATENSQYKNQDFIYGNAFLALPWSGNGADYRDRCKAANDAAPVSSYLGFTFDTSAYDNIVAAITAVQTEYLPGFATGLYTESDYQSFLNKLDAAGINDYIAAAQEQLDAWLAK